MDSESLTSGNYENLIILFLNAQFWIINKIHHNQNNQLGTREQIEEENQCLNELLDKIYEIYLKHKLFLNDSVPHLLNMLQNCKYTDALTSLNHFLIFFHKISSK